MTFRTSPRRGYNALINNRISVSSLVANQGATFWQNPFMTLYQDGALTTVATDGNSVGGVPDRSGNGNTGSQTLTARPILDIDGINGYPSLLFTAASNQYIAVNTLAAATTGTDVAFSCAWVFKNINPNSVRNAYFSAGNSGSGNHYTVCRAEFDTDYRVLRVDSAGTTKTASSTGAIPNTNSHVMSFIFNGTTVIMRLDGVVIANGLDLDVGAMTNNIFSIGAMVRNTIFAPMNGRMGHFIFWPRVITTNEATAIEKAMARDYSITI